MISGSAYSLASISAITADRPLTITKISPMEIERMDLALEQNTPTLFTTAVETKGKIARKMVKVQRRVPIQIGTETEVTTISVHVVITYDKTVATNSEVIKTQTALERFLNSAEVQDGEKNVVRIIKGEL